MKTDLQGLTRNIKSALSGPRRAEWAFMVDEMARNLKEREAEVQRLRKEVEALVHASAELGHETEGLRGAVDKMSHRRCHNCGHVAYYVLDTIPHCRCEKCGAADTRLIRKAAAPRLSLTPDP